jgi:hypothetical protein
MMMKAMIMVMVVVGGGSSGDDHDINNGCVDGFDDGFDDDDADDDADDDVVFIFFYVICFYIKESLKSHTNTLKALIMTQLVADVKALLTTMAKVSYQIISNLNL